MDRISMVLRAGALAALVFASIPAGASAQEGGSCCIEGTGAEWSKAADAHDPGPCLLDQRCTRHSNLSDKPPPRCGIRGPDGVWHGWLPYPGPDGKLMCDWGGIPHEAVVETRTPAQMGDEATKAVAALVARASPGGVLDRPRAEKELQETIDALEKRCASKGGAESDDAIGKVTPDCATAIENLKNAFNQYTRGSGDIGDVAAASPGTAAPGEPGAPEAPGTTGNATGTSTPPVTPPGGAVTPGRNNQVATAEEIRTLPHRQRQRCETPIQYTLQTTGGRTFSTDHRHEPNEFTVVEFTDGGGVLRREVQPWSHSNPQDRDAYDDEGVWEVPPQFDPKRCGGPSVTLGENPGVPGNPRQEARPEQNPNFNYNR